MGFKGNNETALSEMNDIAFEGMDEIASKQKRSVWYILLGFDFVLDLARHAVRNAA